MSGKKTKLIRLTFIEEHGRYPTKGEFKIYKKLFRGKI